MKQRIYILGGGTFTHVRAHMSLAAPAFGETAIKLTSRFKEYVQLMNREDDYEIVQILTKMADRNSKIVTNEDVEKLVEQIIADPLARGVIFNIALADFDGQIGSVQSGKYAERLETANGDEAINITPSKKLIGMFRKERKDIFVVGFKTTSEKSEDEQYLRGLKLLKKNSLNLVLANDLVTRKNMIIVPEEARYSVTTNRDDVLTMLTRMFFARIQNKFTRSTVVNGESIDWNGEVVPDNLREVVNHCIQEGAYKPFLGKTAGHFAVKIDDNTIATSKRKTNFNELDKVGLVKIESKNKDEVIAYGAKPSVGGQSQRIIFSEHPEMECIAHFHCPIKEDAKEFNNIPIAPQWQNECGSHDCGKNTSNHLRTFDLGEGDVIKVVFLDEHGPNIVFNRKTNPKKIINFIDNNFDLKKKTGGLVEEYAM